MEPVHLGFFANIEGCLYWPFEGLYFSSGLASGFQTGNLFLRSDFLRCRRNYVKLSEKEPKWCLRMQMLIVVV